MLSYVFLKKKNEKKKKNNNNNYFYITFKHYNIKPKKQINKKEHYCTHKVHAMNLVLLIRRLSCFVFNFWRTKISSYKFWNNIPFSLILFPTKKQKMLKE